MDGIILIDKPSGITSAEVVRRIKAKVKPSRVGHLGTLDPFATGVLPIMVGEGTKLAPMLEGGEKVYAGVIKLGAETDTLDRDGKVVREAPVPSIDGGSASPAVTQRSSPGRSIVRCRRGSFRHQARRRSDVQTRAQRQSGRAGAAADAHG